MVLMGQAAGIAAALCVKNGIEPRNLEVKQLQRILVQSGCPLGDEERLMELGLRGKPERAKKIPTTLGG